MNKGNCHNLAARYYLAGATSWTGLCHVAQQTKHFQWPNQSLIASLSYRMDMHHHRPVKNNGTSGGIFSYLHAVIVRKKKKKKQTLRHVEVD